MSIRNSILAIAGLLALAAGQAGARGAWAGSGAVPGIAGAGTAVCAAVSAQIPGCAGQLASTDLGAGIILADHKRKTGLRGYRPAWKDDRLNPRRGPRSPYGDVEMYRHFEPGTVPMRPRTSPLPQTLPQGSQKSARPG